MNRYLLILCGSLMLACTSGDSSDDETDTDTDEDTDTDTDVGDDIVWIDRGIESSVTLNAVYTGGTGAWVFGDDGAAWNINQGNSTSFETGATDALRGVWGLGDGGSEELVVVGYSGTVVRVSGDQTTELQDLGTANLNGVDGTGDEMVAVGRAGIYRYTNEEWIFEGAGFGGSLNGVHMGALGTFAIGEDGLLLQFKDDAWSTVDVGVTDDLNGIDGSAERVWVVGENGTALTFDGSEWTAVETGVSANLWDVWVTESGVPYAVGTNGVAIMGGEEEFSVLPTGITNNLYGIWGSSASNVWAVGNRGTVLRYKGND